MEIVEKYDKINEAAARIIELVGAWRYGHLEEENETHEIMMRFNAMTILELLK